MRSITSYGRNGLIAAASAGFVLLTVSTGHAQGFLEQLFGIRPAAPTQPSYSQQDPFSFGVQRRRRHARDWRRSRRPDTRYVALPTDGDGISGKQPVDQKAIQDNPTKAILNDKTLQPGDIVMLPNGPKVFTGVPDKRHHVSEFQDVKSSRMVDRKTRQQLLAMMVPIGAMPADQARKVVAQTRALKLKIAHPAEIASVEAASHTEQTAPRVIVPWAEKR